MGVSHLAHAIAESPTLKLNEEARLLRERGEAVIHLGIGEPKNKAPFTAILGSAAKLSSAEIKYSPVDGIPSLKRAIVQYTEDHYGVAVKAHNVIVTSGAKQAIYNVLYSILNPQEEVVILTPYWVSYPEMVKMVYGVPVIVTAEDGSFHPTIEEIDDVTSSYTKAIILNSPNNPSGVVYSPNFVASVVELAERKNIYLIMDDIYHKLVFDGRTVDSPFKYTEQDIEDSKLVIVNGVSKSYGMTGFRIGWAVANRRLVEIMTNVQAQTTSCASVVLQAAAEGALTGLQTIVENLRLTIENNRNIMMQELQAFSGVKVKKPEGTFYCLPDFRAYSSNSVELCNFLLRKALVVTVPGAEFGMEGYLRLSYAGTVKDVKEGIARMRWALDPESPNEIYIGDRKIIRDWQ